MVLNSVNTNPGALVALASLNNTNAQLNEVQKRVTTGFRVNDSIDDGASFAIAQSLRGEVAAFDAVNQQLSITQGAVGLALEAATNVSDTLTDLRTTLTNLASDSLTTERREQYTADFQRLVGEISNFITNANFQGVNLLETGATDINVITNIDGTQYTINSQVIQRFVGSLNGLVGVGGSVTRLGAAGALGATGIFTRTNAAVTDALNELGGDYRRLTNQIDFNTTLRDATTTAIGTIVDADLARESSRLQALQIRQQLATQTLGIANQAPQVLLGLFR